MAGLLHSGKLPSARTRSAGGVSAQAAGGSAAAGRADSGKRTHAHLAAVDGLHVIVVVGPGAMRTGIEVIADPVWRGDLRSAAGIINHGDGLSRHAARAALVFHLPCRIARAHAARTVHANAVRAPGNENRINGGVVGRSLIIVA